MLNIGGFAKKEDDLGLDLLINPKKVSNSPRGSPRDALSLASEEGEGPIVTIHKRDSDGASFDGSDTSSESEIRVVNATQSDTTSVSSDWRGGAGPPKPNGPSFAVPAPLSAEDILNTKRELLYQFNRLEKKGLVLPRKFSLSSSLEEMKSEYERLKRDMEIDASVRFQRRMLMACVSGVEFLNHKFDPLSIQLDGWSETVQENINDYDDVFEELWDKYHTKVKMAPELRLMFMLGGSAVWFHISHSMFKTMPGVDQVFRQNPELKRQFMDATMKTMQQQQQPEGGGGAGSGAGGGGGLFGSLGNLMGGFFGGGGPPAPANAAGAFDGGAGGERPNMRGPTDVDDLLNELQQERFNRTDDFEIFSNASGLTGITDDPLATVLMEKPDKKGKRRRTLEL